MGEGFSEVAAGLLLHVGWHDAHIREAWKHDGCSIGLAIAVREAGGRDRIFIDYPTDTKLRRCCEAVGALGDYQAGRISPAHFLGHRLWIKIDIEKVPGNLDGGFNHVWDYAAPVGRVVDHLERIPAAVRCGGRAPT